MDAAQWAKEVASHASYNNNEVVEEKKVKPQHEEALNCPRCNSTNTKFCYYNNYSLTQPRYFCKACKRYWTKGGSLRSVPVGGGSRKNKRSSSSSSSSSLPKPIDLSRFSSENYEPAYHHLGFSQFLKLPKIENTITNNSAMSLVSAHQDLNSTHSHPMFNGATRFSLQDFKPTLGFPFQGNGIKYGSFQGNQEEEEEGGERIMLPFGDLNQQHSSRESGHNMGHGNSIGYWNENLGVGDSSTLYN